MSTPWCWTQQYLPELTFEKTGVRTSVVLEGFTLDVEALFARV
jgi:hypothetical protein